MDYSCTGKNFTLIGWKRMVLQIVFGQYAIDLRNRVAQRIQEIGDHLEIQMGFPHAGNIIDSVYWVQNLANWQPIRPVPWDDIPEAEGFWSRFPEPTPDRIGCTFGSTLQPQPAPSTVIIAFSLDEAGAHWGRALRDDDTDELFFGHRGGLGGGGAGNIPIQTFIAAMQRLGITTVQALAQNGDSQEVFNIGGPNELEFPGKLALYVNSCYLIRRLAQTNRLDEFLG